VLKLIVTVVAAAIALAGASESHAAGLGIAVCGLKKSITIPNLGDTMPLGYVPTLHPAAPASPQPFYKLQIAQGASSCNEPQLASGFYIRGANEIRIRGAAGSALWVRLSTHTSKILRDATRRLAPFPKPRKLASAIVDRQLAPRPSSYLRLYTVGTPVRSAPATGSWVSIVLTGSASPWTDGNNSLSVSARGSYLKRDGQLLRIPAVVARRVRSGKALS
jgi:hypothetical protein